MHEEAPAVEVMVGGQPDEQSGACMVPGCSRSQGLAAGGVCNAHRAEELKAMADVAMLLALDVELERCRHEEEEKERLDLERIAELRRERERSAWGNNREHHERRVAGVMRTILRQFETDVSNGRDRNGALTGAAWAVGRLVAGGEVADDHGEAELLDMALAVNLPIGEARGVIRRRFVAARKSPRMLAERPAA